MTLGVCLLAGLIVGLGGAAMESRSKRAEERVTIDLSALRPSLPGLVLHRYGELAPKLVQVDLAALNPQLKPHVIWPQFDQLDVFGEKSFEDFDVIPYLTDEHSLMNPRATFGDFMTDELLSLHDSLPLADEVIVPLDWEEKKVQKKRAIRSPSQEDRRGRDAFLVTRRDIKPRNILFVNRWK